MAIDVRHRQPEDLVLAEVEQRAEIGMVEERDGLGFGDELLAIRLVLTVAGQYELQCNLAIEYIELLRQPHGTHAARSDGAHESDAAPGHQIPCFEQDHRRFSTKLN